MSVLQSHGEAVQELQKALDEIDRLKAALAAQQDGDETMRRLSRVLADAMSWHPSENGPSYTEARNALYERARNIVLGTPEQGVGP